MEKSPATTTETATAPPLPTTTTPSPREEKGEETTTTVENENTDPFSLADDGTIIIDTNNNNNMEDNSEDNAASASASASASATPTDNSKDDGKDGGKSDDGNEVTTSYYSHDNDVEKVTVKIDEDEDVDIVDDIVDDVHNNNDSINVNINGDDNGNENDSDDCNDIDIDKGNENDNEKGDGDNDNDNDNNDNDNDNETTTTYLDGMPIFNYSRIISSGLPLPREGVKKEDDPLTSPSTDDINDNNLDPLATSTSIRRRQQQPRSSCSKLTIARVDPEELIAATKNAMIITTTNSDGHNNTNTNTTAERVDIDTTNNNNIYYNSRNRNRNRNEEALLLSSDLWQQPHLIVACGWDSSSKLSSSSSSSSSSSPMKRRGKITFTRVHQQHQFDSRKNGTDTATATNSNSSNNNGSSSSLSSSPSVVFVTPSKTNTGVVPLSADSGSGGSDPAFTTGSTTTTSSSSSNNNSNKNCNYIYNSNASTELYIQEKEFNSNSWSSGPIYDDTSIVDMSFDASGTALGAIDEGGHCAIWEFKYTTSLQSNLLVFGDTTTTKTTNSNNNSNTNKGMENNNNNNNRSTMLGEEGPSTPTSTPTSSRPQASKTGSSTPARSAGNNNMFSSFMSALTGKPQVDERSRSAGSLFTNTNNNNDESSNSDSTTNNTIQNNNNNIIELIPSLTAEISYQSRINYPASWGPPTSMVIDPAYKRPRKREKSLLVGFSNGRLVLTKRGTFFNRRNDTVIYQASHAATGGSGGSSRKKVSHSYRGIEKVIWRGSLVAWADATGIKLMDMDQLTRIAHIDRPAGARPTLHPSVRDIRPSLVFETSQHLLVGWGDCLMQIHVEEHHDNDHDHRHSGSSSRSVSSGRSDGSVGSSSAVVKKRQTVACTMAWELDCVACDVVPLDADHVAVLGLVPPRPAVVNDEGTDNDNDDNNDDEHINGKKGTTTPYLRKNELEMQVLSRKDGTITHCDALPLIKDNTSVSSPTSSSSSNQIVTLIDSVLDYRLLSSFALPRMEEAEETKVLKDMKGANDMGFIGIDINFDMNQRLFADVDSSAKNMIEFRDPHLQWNIQSIPHDDDEYGDERTDFVCCDTADDDDDDDDRSIDSDDYECILRPMETIKPLQQQIQATAMAATGENQCSPPPTMVVCTDSDAILSLTSTMDDAVESSLARHKYALALFRGLLHKRQLRRYDMNDLISRYLGAVLRINHQSNKNECTVLEEQQPAQRITMTATATTKTVVTPPPRSLSLRRMQLAVKAMPVLLGDRIELWELWCRELENIPGSLFILRNYLPVRDPILPSNLYVRILEKMLTEVEHISNNSKKKKSSLIDIHNEAANHFLESLLAWGSTKVLKEYISFYKYNKERQNGEKSFDKDIRATQIALQRRYLQTAAGYLIFPVQDVEEELQVSAPRYEVHNNDTNDSLFDISELISVVASRVPLVASPKDFGNLTGTDEAHLSYTLTPNNHTCLAAMARLRIMQGEYDLGLKCFLAIGAIHSKDSLQFFEKTAIRVVNGTNITTEDSTSSLIDSQSYEFVMSFIESQNLNQFLLEKEFLLSTSTESKLFMPIFALIRLVGLRRVGNFLIENCVEPDFSYNMTSREANKKAFNLPNSPNDDNNEEPKAILHRGPLPIDKVAEQLKSSPALLHWYLHLVFTRRPDFYINFRTTSTPSKVVTSLHPIHFQSYVDFAGEMRDSSKILAGTEGYKVESKTTPLLTFLRATLPLGGVLPVDARRVLEIERSKDSNNNNNVIGGGGDGNEIDSRESSCSPIFALELAYVIEKYNEQTETDALGILNLYLKGVQSIQLAVSYAQRQKQFSIVLWDHLILYCLKKASDGGVMLFGELLEAAALSGADVARLVERIPPGMVIEGLRPRLVAAVADYRMKLEIYEAAMAAGSEEEVNLMREVGHRVRRGVRYDLEKNRQKSFAELIHEKTKKNINRKKVVASIENNNIIIISNNNSGEPPGTASHKISKTRIRRGHQRLAYSIPRRLLNNEN